MKAPRAELTVEREDIYKLGDTWGRRRTAEEESRCLSMDSPERLLDVAETYVDNVLASTWQPAPARFVKGDILMLRGRHKVGLTSKGTILAATIELWISR